MRKLQRLATRTDGVVTVHPPISTEEINSRQTDYLLLSPAAFARKYRHSLFRPIRIEYGAVTHELQVNFCTNPYCRWFGLPQTRFENVKNKPYRYKLEGIKHRDNKFFVCNPDPENPNGTVGGCSTMTISNWSVADEIARLAQNDTVTDMEPPYEFHKTGCSCGGITPFDSPQSFYRRGTSSGKSQKWQCKVCKKITNVLPEQRQTFTYHQKRNDILPEFARLLVNRTPVKRTCEILGIGSQTYYAKLEWLYRKCLEFLERHERQSLSNRTFGTMWIDTDQLMYYLNNVRKRGHGGARYEDTEELNFPTYIVVSAELSTRYVLRADVAYDWNSSLENIAGQTETFKDDHLSEYARRHARLRFSYAPQPPTTQDEQTDDEFQQELRNFARRANYIDGMHVKANYTALAHYWLIRQMVQAKEWRIVSDQDGSLMTALYRAFAPEIRRAEAHHFLCRTDRAKTRRQAFVEFRQCGKELKLWGNAWGYEDKSVWKLAKLHLGHELENHRFDEQYEKQGRTQRRWAHNPIQHPLATIDKGYYDVDCTTDLSAYDPPEVAEMLMHVNNNATSTFMQQIRRRISILERPLMTARGDGKSYIYANFNPKYAQYAITILRTYYNFCLPYKSRDGRKLTPAQRLGLTEKQFVINDILYFK